MKSRNNHYKAILMTEVKCSYKYNMDIWNKCLSFTDFLFLGFRTFLGKREPL